MSALLLGPILLTVDRIEPPMAVLEWPSGALTDAPLAMLPPTTQEGDLLQLRLSRSRQGVLAAGPPTFLMTTQGLLLLPGVIRPGHRYIFHFQPPGLIARTIQGARQP
jgi:hypothetical protein